MRKQASLAQYTLSGVKAKKANEGRVDMKQPVIYCDCNGWWRVGCKEAIVTQRADHVPGYLFLDGNKLLRPTGTSLLQALNQGAWISHTNMAVEVFVEVAKERGLRLTDVMSSSHSPDLSWEGLILACQSPTQHSSQLDWETIQLYYLRSLAHNIRPDFDKLMNTLFEGQKDASLKQMPLKTLTEARDQITRTDGPPCWAAGYGRAATILDFVSCEVVCTSLEMCVAAHRMISQCAELNLACGGTTNKMHPAYPHDGGYRNLTIHAAFRGLVVEINIVWAPFCTVRSQSWEVVALYRTLDSYFNLDEFGKRGEITLQDAKNFAEHLPFINKKLKLKFMEDDTQVASTGRR